MPAKKCAARKSTAKKSAPKRKTASRKTASRSRSRSSCSTACRQPYMKTASGSCGTVRCMDKETGVPLLGYVRRADGTCAPKTCNTGFVFDDVTGKCVSKKTEYGKALVTIQKRRAAQRVLDTTRQVPASEYSGNHARDYSVLVNGNAADLYNYQQGRQAEQNASDLARQTAFMAELEARRAAAAARRSHCTKKSSFMSFFG